MLQACTHRQASKPITVMRNVSIRLKASRTQKIGTDGVGHPNLRRASPLLADRGRLPMSAFGRKRPVTTAD